MDKAYGKIGRQIGFSYLITILQLLFAPLIVALLTRTLGPGRYGAYVLFFAFVSFGAMVLQLGISQFVITKLSSYKEKQRPPLFFSLALSELAILIAFAAVFFFSPLGSFFLRFANLEGYGTILGLALLTMLFVTIGRTYDYYYKVKQKINLANFMEFFRSQLWVLPLAFIFLYFKNFNLAHIFALWSVFAALSLSIYLWLDKKDISSFLKTGVADKGEILPAFKFGLPLAASAIFTWMLIYVDRYILSYYTSTSVVGVYSVAASILGILLTFGIAATNVIMPYFTEAWWKNRAKFATFLNASLKYGIFILVPGIIGAIVLRYELVTLVAGPQYTAASGIIITLGLFPLFAFFNTIFGTCLFLQDKTRLALYISIAGAAINIALNFLLIPYYGVHGAATAVVLSNFVIFAIILHQSRMSRQVDLKFLKLPQIIISAVIMGVILSFFHPANIATKIAALFGAAALYAAITFLTGALNKSELDVIKSLFRNK